MYKKRQRFSSTQSLASQSSKGTYGKRTVKSKGKSQLSLVQKTWKATIPRWGFPNRMYIAHKYTELYTKTSTTSSFATHQWIANGMFDPNATGTGHQPMYFDNLAAIYDHYTVVRSTCKFTFCPSAAPTTPIEYVAFIDDDSTFPNTMAAAKEKQLSKSCLVPLNHSDPVVMTLEWNARDTFGGDPLSNDALQGTSAGNPTEIVSFVSGAQVSVGATTSFVVTAEIIYYAVWDELSTQNIN